MVRRDGIKQTWGVAAAICMACGCNGGGSPGTSPSSVSNPSVTSTSVSSETAVLARTKKRLSAQICFLPESDGEGEANRNDLSAEDLPTQFQGDFLLDQVKILHRAVDAKGALMGAFVVETSIAEVAGRGPRTVNFRTECEQTLNPAFISEASLLLVTNAHFPSGRVTVFDRGDRLDQPEFNYPAYARLRANSLGSRSLKMDLAERGPPYLRGLSFRDWLAQLPGAARARIVGRDAFEMRVRWREERPRFDDRAQGNLIAESEALLRFSRK